MEHLGKEVIRLESSVPAKQELQLQKNGDTLEQALAAGQVIQDAPLSDLKEALRYAMVKIGLRSENWPGEEEKALLVLHIVKEYGQHTAAEIRLAFDMALAGKLGLKEVSCFENFSCLYFSTIMNAYRAWAKEEYKQIKAPAPVEEKKVLTDEQFKTETLEWLERAKDKVWGKGWKVDFIPILLFEDLDKLGMIKYTDEEWMATLLKAVEYRQGQLGELAESEGSSTARDRVRDFARMKEEGCFTGEHADYLPILAKKMILWDLILRMQI